MTRGYNFAFRLFLAMSLVALFVVSCAPKKIDPTTQPVFPEDSQQAQFPPSDEELVYRPLLVADFLIHKDPGIPDDVAQNILDKSHKTFELHGNMDPVPASEIDAVLSREENRIYQPSNAADLIRLGKQLKADFAIQSSLILLESKMDQEGSHFKVQLEMTIFTTGSGQAILKESLVYDSAKPQDYLKLVKQLVQNNFPLRGYILETRGAKTVAKITLGHSTGIEVGREFLVRERQVETQMVGGMVRKIVSYPTRAMAKVKVIRVMENESWVLVETKDREKIKKGQVVFSLPEKDGWL